MAEEQKNYLGIDWGKAKVGLALGHEETKVALGYGVLPNTDELFSALGKIIKEEGIGIVIIGIPKHVNLESETFEGKILGKALEEGFSVRVIYQDEMFTTKMAQDNLIERGGKGVSKEDDQEAARLILQAWLERRPA